MKLFLVRHGETDWNKELRYQGHRDTTLNSNGLCQAEKAGKILAAYRPGFLYTSDLKRAVQTAEIIGKHLNLISIKDKRLREIDFGDWEGKTYNEVKKMYPKDVETWRKTPLQATVTGGEKLNAVVERMQDAVESICLEAVGDAVLVSHGGPIRLFLRCMELEGAMWEYPVKPGSITVIECNGKELKFIEQLNS